MQSTQKEYPIVVLPFYTEKQKTKKTRNIVSKSDLDVTGQSTHKIEPSNAFQMQHNQQVNIHLYLRMCSLGIRKICNLISNVSSDSEDNANFTE